MHGPVKVVLRGLIRRRFDNMVRKQKLPKMFTQIKLEAFGLVSSRASVGAV